MLQISKAGVIIEAALWDKKPVCRCPGFKCLALRPRQYTADGRLVHYCGLGVPGQRPLRSYNTGIVKPNKACPVSHMHGVLIAKTELGDSDVNTAV